MPLSLTFRGVGPRAGHRCELYHGSPYTRRELDGKIDPLETVTLTADSPNGPFRAAFAKNPGSGYAIRLIDAAGDVYARSNTRPAAAPADLAILDLPFPQELTTEDLNRNLELPESNGKTTVDKLSLVITGNELALLGHAVRDGAIRARKLSFDFRFQLKPAYLPVWTPVDQLDDKKEMPGDTMELHETSLKLDGDKGGHAGILQLIRPLIRRVIRKRVQRGLHETLLKKTLEGQPGTPAPGALPPVLTVRSVSIGGGLFKIAVCVLMDQPGV